MPARRDWGDTVFMVVSTIAVLLYFGCIAAVGIVAAHFIAKWW